MNRLDKVLYPPQFTLPMAGKAALPRPLMAAWTSGCPVQGRQAAVPTPSSCLPPVGPPAFNQR